MFFHRRMSLSERSSIFNQWLITVYFPNDDISVRIFMPDTGNFVFVLDWNFIPYFWFNLKR